MNLDENFFHAAGVYRIENTITRYIYIGLSIDVKKRMGGHRSNLRRGNHNCDRMQFDWKLYGENSFSASIIKYIEEEDPTLLKLTLRMAELQEIVRLIGEPNYKQTFGLYNQEVNCDIDVVPTDSAVLTAIVTKEVDFLDKIKRASTDDEKLQITKKFDEWKPTKHEYGEQAVKNGDSYYIRKVKKRIEA